MAQRRPVRRTVARCEAYLARLAEIAATMGDDAHLCLPLFHRLERELAEARTAEAGLSALRGYLVAAEYPAH